MVTWTLKVVLSIKLLVIQVIVTFVFLTNFRPRPFFEDGKSTWNLHDEANKNFFNLRWKFLECLFEVGVTRIQQTNDAFNSYGFLAPQHCLCGSLYLFCCLNWIIIPPNVTKWTSTPLHISSRTITTFHMLNSSRLGISILKSYIYICIYRYMSM